MPIRLRLGELAERKRLSTYALAKRLEGRGWSSSLVYRVVRQGGAFKCLTPDQIEALCDVFEVTPGTLFHRD